MDIKTKDVDIIDNFLSDELLSHAINAINDSKWEHDGHSLTGTRRLWFCELGSNVKFKCMILDAMHKRYRQKFKVMRVYANGQTFGQDGSFHQDDTRENTYTFLMYVSDINTQNIDEIGGFTQIKMKDGIMNIEPYIGRAVMFKSNLFHRGLAPSRESDILRQTIAFKLIVDSGSKEIQYI
tara:strand:+ start:496 stop:1038 length:543 start_codon:yes stop_codon:yes gene_type:complete